MFLAGGAAAIIAVFAVMVIVVAMLPRRTPSPNESPAVAGGSPSAPDTATAGSPEERNFLMRYPPPTVAFINVSHPFASSKDAEEYLLRKIRRAAAHDYERNAALAAEKTEANRLAAVEAANNNPSQQAFYQILKSTLEPPDAGFTITTDGKYRFFACPVLNVAEFAKRLPFAKIEGVSEGTRTINVSVSLPAIIPDAPTEALIAKYGEGKVVRVTLKNSPPLNARLTYYLESRLASGADSARLELGMLRQSGPNQVEFLVIPAVDLKYVADRLELGTIESIRTSERQLVIQYNRTSLPTEEEIAEAERKRIEALQAERVAKEAATKTDTTSRSPFDKKPHPGEHPLEWVARAVQRGIYRDQALDELEKHEVNDAYRGKVAAGLALGLASVWSRDLDRYVGLMVKWKGPETVDALRKYLTSWGRDAEHAGPVLNGLSRIKEPEAAEAIATIFDSRLSIINRDVFPLATKALSSMGSVAEEAVHKHLEHAQDEVRAMLYNVLGSIGTGASVTKLQQNQSRERVAGMKALAGKAITEIRKRHPAGSGTTGSTSASAKPSGTTNSDGKKSK